MSPQVNVIPSEKSAHRLGKHRIQDLRICGFSLVEMMVALFILSFSILGLTSLTVNSMRVNHQNDVRNMAVRVAGETSEKFFSLPLDSIGSGSETTNVPLRGGTQAYDVTWTVTNLTTDLKQIEISVEYVFRDQTYSMNSVIYRQRSL